MKKIITATILAALLGLGLVLPKFACMNKEYIATNAIAGGVDFNKQQSYIPNNTYADFVDYGWNNYDPDNFELDSTNSNVAIIDPIDGTTLRTYASGTTTISVLDVCEWELSEITITVTETHVILAGAYDSSNNFYPDDSGVFTIQAVAGYEFNYEKMTTQTIFTLNPLVQLTIRVPIPIQFHF